MEYNDAPQVATVNRGICRKGITVIRNISILIMIDKKMARDMIRVEELLKSVLYLRSLTILTSFNCVKISIRGFIEVIDISP